MIMFNPSSMNLILDDGRELDHCGWFVSTAEIKHKLREVQVDLCLEDLPHEFPDKFEYELARTTAKFCGAFYCPHSTPPFVGIMAYGSITNRDQLINYNVSIETVNVQTFGEGFQQVPSSRIITMTLTVPLWEKCLGGL